MELEYILDLTDEKEKKIYELGEEFQDVSINGKRLSYTNYYMQMAGRPYYGISGEFHFSRIAPERWKDEILKMKACGLNTISTYVFWMYHEETEGEFDFTGHLDLRRFVQLCGQYSMNVILRIGPYAHGECRNGGLPDWLYAKPFTARKLNSGFLDCVRKYFEQIGRQTRGLYFRNGGPIIAVQIDNEYMHSSSQWNFSRGVNQEFVFGGDEGDRYMTGIRDVAVESGITPAFFTATAWGGAVVPDCMIPMWGGYAYRPWMLFEDGTHPKTDEFVYQNFHKDGIESTYDFHPSYRPETRPYGCCEIGSGMMVGYRYRFQYPCKSVDAVANIKMASGCNFLGYYMFHGGSHPHGKDGTYMNDGSLPKISYDYQAPIGEYGQVRESFRRVKNIHYFAQTFQEKLCCMQTVLPEKASEIRPEDETTLRYAVRTDGKSGFLFVNNFQDHLQMPDKTDQRIRLICGKEELVFPITIAGSDNAILPFHLDIDGIDLVMGTAQPLTVLRGNDGINIHVFFVHEKMEGGFLFEKNAFVRETGKNFFSWDSERQAQEFYVEKGEVKARILVLSQKMAEQMYIVKKSGLIFTQGVILEDGETIRLESSQNENLIFTFPEEMKLALPEYKDGKQEGLPVSMNAYVALCDRKECAAVLKHTDECRYILELPDGCLDNVKDVVLKIDYIGDIGNAFIGSRLISDNYANQQTWEIGLSDFKREIRKEKMVFYISPLKKGVKLIIDNQMAAVREIAESVEEKILDIRLEPIYEIILKKKREFPGFVLQQKFSR